MKINEDKILEWLGYKYLSGDRPNRIYELNDEIVGQPNIYDLTWQEIILWPKFDQYIFTEQGGVMPYVELTLCRDEVYRANAVAGTLSKAVLLATMELIKDN